MHKYSEHNPSSPTTGEPAGDDRDSPLASSGSSCNDIRSCYQSSLSDFPGSPDGTVSLRSNERRTEERTEKWLRMLNSDLQGYPPKLWTRKHHKFETRLFKGIPSKLRPRVWSLFLRVGCKDSTLSFSFEHLFQINSEYERQIDLDIERTLRENALFRERYGHGQTSLFKILVSLANAFPQVGYCQGMSTVCAFLLVHLEDPEKAFSGLVEMFYRNSLSFLYSSGFPKLFETFFIHEGLFQLWMPELYSHFVGCIFAHSRPNSKWRRQSMQQNEVLLTLEFEGALALLSGSFSLYLEQSKESNSLVNNICFRIQKTMNTDRKKRLIDGLRLKHQAAFRF